LIFSPNLHLYAVATGSPKRHHLHRAENSTARLIQLEGRVKVSDLFSIGIDKSRPLNKGHAFLV
jgi:hypothetical protein